MLENDISHLNAHEGINLEGLEADIWRRERHVRSLRAANRMLTSWQGVVLVLAVAASAAMGAAMTSRLAQPSSFLAAERLAPSNLLLGSR